MIGAGLLLEFCHHGERLGSAHESMNLYPRSRVVNYLTRAFLPRTDLQHRLGEGKDINQIKYRLGLPTDLVGILVKTGFLKRLTDRPRKASEADSSLSGLRLVPGESVQDKFLTLLGEDGVLGVAI